MTTTTKRSGSTEHAKQAWERLLDSACVTPGAPAFVTHADIHSVGVEPRLAAKFDHSGSLPAFLAEGGLYVSPSKGGYWVLAEGGFVALPAASELVILPGPAATLWTAGIGEGETGHLTYGSRCGVLHHFFNLDPTLTLAHLHAGRRVALPAEYRVGDADGLNIGGVQIESDWTVGNEESGIIFNIEAKKAGNGDFNPRQLFFPHMDLIARTLGEHTAIFDVFWENHGEGDYTLHEVDIPSDDICAVRVRQTRRYRIDHSGTLTQPLTIPLDGPLPGHHGAHGDALTLFGGGSLTAGRRRLAWEELASLGLAETVGDEPTFTVACASLRLASDPLTALAHYVSELPAMAAYRDHGARAAEHLVACHATPTRRVEVLHGVQTWASWAAGVLSR